MSDEYLKKPKLYSECYLFKANVYELKLVKYIQNAKVIDKSSKEFEGILMNFKNVYPKWLYRYITGKNLQFLIPAPDSKVSKAFNGFACKKNGEGMVIGVVNASILSKHMKSQNFILDSRKESIMQGYILSAFISYIYLSKPRLFTGNPKVIQAGGEVYARFVNHILHYLFKINSIPKLAEEAKVLARMYFYLGIVKMDNLERAISLSTKNCKLGKFDLATLNLEDVEGKYDDINTFVTKVLAVQPGLEKLTTSMFVEKWIQLFGAGTEFAMEMLPAFLTMLTNEFCSSYATNINTIHNIIGNRNILAMEVMRIGGSIYG